MDPLKMDYLKGDADAGEKNMHSLKPWYIVDADFDFDIKGYYAYESVARGDAIRKAVERPGSCYLVVHHIGTIKKVRAITTGYGNGMYREILTEGYSRVYPIATLRD